MKWDDGQEYDGALIIAGKPAIFTGYNEQIGCDSMNVVTHIVMRMAEINLLCLYVYLTIFRNIQGLFNEAKTVGEGGL